MEYKELTDWRTVEAEFKRRGVVAPSKTSARVFAAIENDEVVGFLVVQLVVHAEPIWIHEDYRGKVNWQKLVRMGEDFLGRNTGREYYAFAPNDHIEAMCEIVGMEKMLWIVYRKKL